ncbi:uncharacterized protein BDZ99DRAFT_473011 [Mytilinidion resinicola]|uniref:JmjC domain-containing protein n=1 Tax=Mytilinidion resinicola TaxID=574789 RepID=A0A6A6YY32_9PEZI|nr:uncharacterized protein BDZ99DRAFT_473011 [Mytilinidion resinicola]KAF2813856.1 hypothetical protein BDZ99DRAFT_473011 [Mytilinidion resinicola]
MLSLMLTGRVPYCLLAELLWLVGGRGISKTAQQGAQASRILSSHSTIKVPIFGLGQQNSTWSAQSRPISQLLAKYSTLDDAVDINIASLPRTHVSYSRKTIREVQSRFKENKDHGNGWNILDLKNPLPDTYGICPRFLQNSNCDLLNRIKTAVLNPGWAGRIITKSKQKNEFREVEGWILLAEPGTYTGPHIDAYATETFINCNKEEFGIFPAGFVYFVLRLSSNSRQTMGIRGHILRCSAIAQWAKILALQLEYPNPTNKKVAKTALTYLLTVLCLVREAGAQGRLEEFGGEKKRGRVSTECAGMFVEVP